MRKTVYLLSLMHHLPTAFDDLRITNEVKVAAIALGIDPNKIAFQVIEQRNNNEMEVAQKEKAKK